MNQENQIEFTVDMVGAAVEIVRSWADRYGLSRNQAAQEIVEIGLWVAHGMLDGRPLTFNGTEWELES